MSAALFADCIFTDMHAYCWQLSIEKRAINNKLLATAVRLWARAAWRMHACICYDCRSVTQTLSVLQTEGVEMPQLTHSEIECSLSR